MTKRRESFGAMINEPTLRAAAPAEDRITGFYRERYHAIDGWRGIAALTVVIHHTTRFPLGNFGVLLFFVISGYCVTCAIESGMRKQLSWWEFLKRRVHRIYPPYYCAIVFYCITRFVKWKMTGVNDIHLSWVGWLQTLTLTQWLTLVFSGSDAAQGNPTLLVSVFWSLNYEEQFYFVTGLLFFFLGWRRFPIAMLVSGLAALVWVTLFLTSYYGFFTEFWWDFVLGAIVFYRLCRTSTVQGRFIDIGLTLLLLLWVIISLVGPQRLGLESQAIHDQMIVTGFAIVLIATRRFDGLFQSSLWGFWLGQLGKISYSLYLVHQFNLALCIGIVNAIGGRHFPDWLHVTLQIACHIAIATVFWYFCERPFLNKPVTAKTPD